MIARRLSFPMIRSPDCGYSSTKSSVSSRSCASKSLAAIACMSCSTVLRLSAICFLPWRRDTRSRRLRGAYARHKRRGPLRTNVLIQVEHVVGIVGSLQSAQPLVLIVAVDPANDVVTLLDGGVHVVACSRVRLQSGQRRAAPRDATLVPLLLDPERVGVQPVRRAATGEGRCVLGDVGGGPAH